MLYLTIQFSRNNIWFKDLLDDMWTPQHNYMKVQQDWIHSSLEQDRVCQLATVFKNTKKPSAIVLNVPDTQLQKLSLGTVRLKKSSLGSIQIYIL